MVSVGTAATIGRSLEEGDFISFPRERVQTFLGVSVPAICWCSLQGLPVWQCGLTQRLGFGGGGHSWPHPGSAHSLAQFCPPSLPRKCTLPAAVFLTVLWLHVGSFGHQGQLLGQCRWWDLSANGRSAWRHFCETSASIVSAAPAVWALK